MLSVGVMCVSCMLYNMSSCVHPPPFKTPFPKFATSSANNECDVPYILALCRAYRFFRRHQDQQTNKQTKKERQAEETFLKQIFFFSAIGIVHGRFRFCPS